MLLLMNDESNKVDRYQRLATQKIEIKRAPKKL
jgi:hypothetical protein